MKGIAAKKGTIEWYQQILTKAELIEYTDVSGCYVLRPRSYAIWEKIQQYMDKIFKEKNIKNAYFPLFIPEANLVKEEEHVEGFTPEVAWVTHHGNKKMEQKLAVRPTSETIMYPSYAKWIRSHKDLPLLINQWCNVVRWEFKNPQPFLRSREFLWQEGHTVHATKKGADNEVREMLGVYKQTYEDLMAIPVIEGLKTDKEKFAGADYTTSVETFLPSAQRAIQGATSHHLGQNFAKAFGISFKDKDEKEKTPFQNSWGFTTRSIGILIYFHSDDKGLVLPPKLAPEQIVIIPILFDDSKEKVLKTAKKLKSQLEKDYSVILDDREEYTPGWKYNDWEMKGIPIRIEIGPKDVEKDSVMIIRRDNGEKQSLPNDKSLNKELEIIMNNMQSDLLKKGKKFIEKNTIIPKDFKEFKDAINKGKIVRTFWCNTTECEETIKHETGGAKSLNMPFDSRKVEGNCPKCGKPATVDIYFGKSW